MTDVVRHRRIGIMDESVLELASVVLNPRLQIDAVVWVVSGHNRHAATEEAQFRIRVESSVLHPPAQEKILARSPAGIWRTGIGQHCTNLISQAGADLFVCV